MSTIKEASGPKISPYMQILYGLFNLLLLVVMVVSFWSVGGFTIPSVGLKSPSNSTTVRPPTQPELKNLVTGGASKWHTPARFPECSMDACFNYSRCDDMAELRVFRYGKGSPSWFFNDAFERSPYYTKDPAQACLFLVTVDRRLDASDALQTLPYWNHGLNHVIVSIADNWVKRSDDDASIEMASTMSAITHQSTYRAGFDISVPVPQKRFYRNLQGLKARERKYFLTFKGTRYLQDAGVGGFRSNPILRGMHNGRDMIVATTCKQTMLDPNCAKDQSIYDQYKFDDLMNSTFGLVPAGRGPSSFRLLEVLSAGSIPVVISDNFVLPFDSLIEWRRCLFVFPTSQTHRIALTLRSLGRDEIEHRRQYCVFLYREFLMDDDTIVATTAMALKARFFGVLPKLTPNVPLPPTHHLNSQQQQQQQQHQQQQHQQQHQQQQQLIL